MKFTELAEKQYAKLVAKEVDGEVIYFRERRVYPVISQEGKINWFNLITGGTWFKLFTLILFLIIMFGFIFEYKANLESCTKAMDTLNAMQNITLVNNEYTKQMDFQELNLSEVNTNDR